MDPLQQMREHQQSIQTNSTTTLARLVFVIVAFKDAEHIERIIQAIWTDQHSIILHLERTTPTEYRDQIDRIASKYTTVVVVQFGTIVYGTDAISLINYRIMNWVVNDVGLRFDFYLTMDGAVYPLWNAQEMALHMGHVKASRNVWMGEAFRAGVRSNEERNARLLMKQKVILTVPFKYQHSLSASEPFDAMYGFNSSIPLEHVYEVMRYKTNSGNSAVFSYKVVKELVKSAQVRLLFALAKYGCCDCVEERTWVAALGLLNETYRKEALEHSSILQLWGGRVPTMSNTILEASANVSYRLEDATVANWTIPLVIGDRFQKRSMNLFGNHLPELLNVAKRHGFLFARKLQSNNQGSMELLQLIQRELHGS